MARIALVLLILLCAIALIVLTTTKASGHHNTTDGIEGKLPLIPNTAMLLNFKRTGEITWCTDARATSYPRFVDQLHEVNNAAYLATGIPHRQVPFSPDPAVCNEQHTMPDEAMGDNVAGSIQYANWPVKVKYNWRLGFTSWRATQGHEGTNCGHNMGEHEGYDDLRFVSHILTYGRWAPPWNAVTVMDFGTHLLPQFAPLGVWECQPSDVRLIHSWLLPRQVKEAGIKNWQSDNPSKYRGQIYYCGGDTARADRVALMAIAPWGEAFWSGNSFSVTSGCTEIALYSEPGWCFDWSSELSAWVESWAWPQLRNDGRAGCV